ALLVRQMGGMVGEMRRARRPLPTCRSAATGAAIDTMPVASGCRALAVAGIATAALAAATLGLCRLVVADALHHLLARGLGRRLHHVAARRLAGAAPDGLAAHGDGLGALAFLGAEALDDLDGDLLLGEALDVLHEAFLVEAYQAHCLAGRACAARAADAVHVVFTDVGNLVVDDVRQL